MPSEAALEDRRTEADPLLGRCLDDTYLIEGVIGEGGVGRVYRARHARIKTKLFALKVLHPEHSRDPGQLARFQQEAEAAATLSHPQVVGVYDVGRTEDGYSYLVCELLEGVDLDGYLEKYGKLDPENAVLLGLQVAAALEVAHAQNIAHRDLKPQNVFLLHGPDGTLPEHPQVKVLDFGLSRFLDSSDTQLTKTGSLVGTPAFMAPEQAMGTRGDQRVDVYGIGVILYAALTGQAPFIEDNLAAMLVAVMTAEPVRPRKLQPEISESLELIVQRAMSREPGDRYQSVSDLRLALEGVLAATHGPSDVTGMQFRAPMPSAVNGALAVEETYELKTSRIRLVIYGVSIVLLGLALVASALSGLELFTGHIELTRVEVVLVLAGISGTLAMPMILAFREFRRSVWSNSAKVVDLLARVRGPLTAGLLTYGVASIAIRFLDEFVSRLDKGSLFAAEPGIAWPGFTLVLPCAALLAALFSYLKRRTLESPYDVKKRTLWGAPLHLATLLCVVGLITLGLRFREASEPAIKATIAEPSSALPSTLTAENRAGEPPPSPPPSARDADDDDEPVLLVGDEELARAVAEGLDGLLPLSEKYPRDPRVLEPLLLAFASRATGLADAMVTAERLLSVAPEKRDSDSLGLIVQRAAKTPGAASDQAFDLMRRHLGPSGADLLYQLAKGSSKVSARASELLGTQEVQAQMSPSLRILFELESAESCEARLPLLDRAKQLGDARAANYLGSLVKATKTGCGKGRYRPCPARCEGQTKAFWDTVEAIQARSGGTEL